VVTRALAGWGLQNSRNFVHAPEVGQKPRAAFCNPKGEHQCRA